MQLRNSIVRESFLNGGVRNFLVRKIFPAVEELMMLLRWFNWSRDMAALAFGIAVALTVTAACNNGPSSVHAFGNMNTLAAMFGDIYPTDGYYGLCAIQPKTLLLECRGNHYNYTDPPRKTPMWAVSGGGYFSCGLTYPAQNPVCWGAKDLDNSTRDAITIPVAYQGVRYSSISSGGWHTCAIRDDGSGTVDCWGVLSSPGVAMKAVSAGADVMYGLKLDNSSYTWGINWKSRARIWKNDPQSHYSAIYSGWYHVCGIELITNATLCWGINEDRQCDAPTNYTFSALTLGKNHTCGLREDNHTAVCWGDNTYGQCDAPIGIPFSLISAADWFTCGVRRDLLNQVLCWGTVQGNVNQLASSEGTCLGFCQSDQYYIGGKCPSATDIICLDCSSCSSGMVLSSPCGSTNDTICVPQPPPSPPHVEPRPTPLPSSSSSSSNSSYIIVGASVGGLLVLVALVGSIFFVIRRRRANPSTQEPSGFSSPISSQGIQEFNSSTIQEATSSYSEDAVLGIGGSCRVYKGVFRSGEEVAVKKPIDTPNDRLFEQELQLLKRLNHICLVNLIGYCRHEKLLIFEFMANGSLYDCLFQKRSPELDWKTRIKVAAQAARGLVYLHNDVRPSIIHRDVKSANVLLDKNWDAHVSDFGISLFGPNVGDTHIIGTSIVGTPGYLDPEYTQTLILTTKSDVYSFGVVLLELLFGRPACMKGQEFTIVNWASTIFQSGNIRLDPSLAMSIDTSILHELLELAMKCIKPKRQDRPDMVHVSRKLEGFLERAKM